MKKYRQKPVIVEAAQYDATNHEELIGWLGSGPFLGGTRAFVGRSGDLVIAGTDSEDGLRVRLGDYVVKALDGRVLRLTANAFEAAYEEA